MEGKACPTFRYIEIRYFNISNISIRYPTLTLIHPGVPRDLNDVCNSFLGDRRGWDGDAVVQVTLHNNSEGHDFDEYGSSITVRRTIKQSGGSEFTLIGHDGQVSAQHQTDHDLDRHLDPTSAAITRQLLPHWARRAGQ